jgi:HEPN domain-containing protein
MGRSRGATPFSISSMISCREIPADLFSVARSLDRNYIPARYPDGFSRGKPADYFTQEDADDAVSGAERIVQFCDGLLA